MVQSQRAELIIMERRDVSKYLKRSVRAEMDAILGFWDYESVLEQSVRFKIEHATGGCLGSRPSVRQGPPCSPTSSCSASVSPRFLPRRSP